MTKKILLADDSVTIQKVIELTFMDQDYEVLSVSNGDDAVSNLGEMEPDLVITDVHMPGASGFEVARQSKDRNPDVPVLLLVGTFEPFDESDYEESGADAYLKKPFDSQELLELVEDLAAQAPADGASPALAEEPAEEPESVELAEEGDVSFADMELDLDDDGGDDDLSLGTDDGDDLEDDRFDLTDADLGEAEEDTAGLGGGEAVWGNLDLEESDDEAAPVVESTAEEADDEAQPFRLSDEPGESFALESETVPEETSEEEEPEMREPTPEPEFEPVSAPLGNGTGLSDEDVERIARRVADLIGETVLRDVAWEVIPDLAEVVIKDRIRELERQVE